MNGIRFLLDGAVRTLEGVDPTRTVLQVLREDLGRTGTKEGCAEGDCGACTVVLAEHCDGAIRARAVNSCIQLAPTLDGKALITVESLAGAGGRLHPVQQALVQCHASQCGFCTPGFVMSLFALYKTQAAPGRSAILDALAGNLCRCTGYRPIVDAAQQMYSLGRQQPPETMDWLAAPSGVRSESIERSEGELSAKLRAIRRTGQLSITHGARSFHAPRDLATLAALKTRMPAARLLAGGTDIGLWVTKQLRDLGDVIYVGEVEELKAIRVDDGAIEVGAAVTLSDACPALARDYPALETIFRRFGSPPIRNAGTLAGNIANGSPIGDSLPCLIAIGASVVLQKGSATRELPIERLYLDYQKTAIEPGEFIRHVRVPRRRSALFRAWKVSKRFDQDISSVCGAFLLELDAGGRIAEARVAFGGMAAVPRRAPACEAALAGRPWNEATAQAAAQALASDYRPIDDLRASSRYRMKAAQNLLHRLYLETAGAAKAPVDIHELVAAHE
ncbi:MAG TPA: xanthine dehydrogenase small subunit [Burkholderiales bacterium]